MIGNEGKLTHQGMKTPQAPLQYSVELGLTDIAEPPAGFCPPYPSLSLCLRSPSRAPDLPIWVFLAWTASLFWPPSQVAMGSSCSSCSLWGSGHGRDIHTL